MGSAGKKRTWPAGPHPSCPEGTRGRFSLGRQRKMSLYKVTARLNGTAVDESDDEEEEAVEVPQEEEEEEEEEEEATGLTQEEKEERAKRRRWDREWDEQHFISRRKAGNGKIIYGSTLIDDVTFFSREEMVAFTKGKRYKRLLHQMKVGMRTHDDKEKLRGKAEARRERKRPEREAKEEEKRKRRRIGKSVEDIDKRKAAFQQKKARRMANKAAAGQAT